MKPWIQKFIVRTNHFYKCPGNVSDIEFCLGKAYIMQWGDSITPTFTVMNSTYFVLQKYNKLRVGELDVCMTIYLLPKDQFSLGKFPLLQILIDAKSRKVEIGVFHNDSTHQQHSINFQERSCPLHGSFNYPLFKFKTGGC